jgi:Tol biopolymer transport system component
MDIWLHELTRGIDTRFTFHASRNATPVWSPDGRRIAFASTRTGSSNLYVKDTNGIGQDDPLLEAGPSRIPTDWSRDGRYLLYSETGSKTKSDLWVLQDPGGSPHDRKPIPFLQSPFDEGQGQFSPDGRWIAYTSNESGRDEVYIRSFPSGAGKWKISITGGQFPRWRHDGRELFYLSPDHKLMVAALKAASGFQPVFEVAAPHALFETRIPNVFNFPYAIAGNGTRFLLNNTVGDAVDTPLTVVVNWLASVKK